jgi:hypothetical protein
LANSSIAAITVEYNWGAPIAFGLRVDGVADWSHYTHNIFHNAAYDIAGDPSPITHLPGWTHTNGVAFEIGNSDWINLEDEQEWGYSVGVSLLYNGTFYNSFGPIWVKNSQFDACWYACISVNPNSTDVGIINLRVTGNTFAPFDGFAFTQSPVSGGIALYVNGNSTIKTLNFSHNFIFGPANYAMFISFATDLIIDSNMSVENVQSTIAAAGPAFTLGNGTTANITNNIMNGFNSVYSIGTYTNVDNTGNFTH